MSQGKSLSVESKNMSEIITELLGILKSANPVQYKKVQALVESSDQDFTSNAIPFLNKYKSYLIKEGKQLDFAVDCYCKMNNDMVYERIQFLKTGEYKNKNFYDVEKAIYNNSDVMEYHMHGLVLAQFFWIDQYHRFLNFSENLPQYKSNINKYLEVGGGHGLYLYEAINRLGNDVDYDLVDISMTSIELSKGIIDNDMVNYHHVDIFGYDPGYKYDFITIGEVLEHLEEPKAMMDRLGYLLNDNGHIYVTTPVNAPMIDHIYLFNNADEIRNMIVETGFEIVKEKTMYAEDAPKEKAEKYKMPLMYSSFIKKKENNGKTRSAG